MALGLLGFETTIASPFRLTGVGVHSGAMVSASFSPAEAGTGIVFQRVGPEGVVAELKAVAASVGNTDLCTILGFSPQRSIATVEHVMAALQGLGIDNVVIEVDGGEMPVMDGSSLSFVEAIDQVGIRSLGVKRRYIRIREDVRVESGASWATFTPYEGTRFEVEIEFDSPLIGRQAWRGDINAVTFRNEIARARTFGFMRDVQKLWSAGLALGSSLENSVVIGDDDRIVNPEGLRFVDEFVRHKTLDAIGDLALAGTQFIGCYCSWRGGHRLNAMALNALLARPSAYEIVEVPTRRPAARVQDMIRVHAPEYAPWSA